MHRRAADALQELHQEQEEEVAAAITQHLIKGGGSQQQITKYAEIAGNRAYSLSAYPEAQHHYEVAIAHREKAKRREGKIQQSEPVVTASAGRNAPGVPA